MMHFINKLSFISTCFIFVVSCGCGDNRKNITLALENAGTNKNELLNVINHYQQSPADSLKLTAACFLIENMPYHFSYDTTWLPKYRPVTEKIKLSRERGLSIQDIKHRVNPLMDSLNAVYPLGNIYSKRENDVTSVSPKMLINNIDLAFEHYNRNPFKDSILFGDFLKYVLPYRIQNGPCIEDWRSYFIKNYSHKTEYSFSRIDQLCDSLLYQFKEIELGWKIAEQFPYLKLDDYLTSQLASCLQKCWFNCMLLRSFGIPVTIDFVPASRVHESGHEWNTIKLKGGILPFDPFWEGVHGNRYLKAFYSRSANHPIIGAIQFPKIYRKTFKAHITELLEHATTSGEKVPSFFLNPFILDVTNEYFTTFDITAPLIKRNYEKADYAYACVMGAKRAWIPVGYGKIKSRRTKFHSLGSNNVYLPAYYQTGNMTPAGYPILLNDNGSALILCPDLVNTRSIKISSVAYFRPRLEEFKKSFNGCTIEGADNVNFKNSEILYQLANAYEPGTYRIPVCSNSKYRFIRFKIRNSTIKINEFKLFSASGETENELEGKPIYSDASDSLMLRKSVDHDKLTGANFDELSDEHKLSGNIWIGYDFKKPVSISAFEFYYALNVNIRDQGVYELLYWDFGWKSLGIKKSSSISVNFDKVPENALLMIKIHDTNSYSRIFTYSNEKQHWW